MDSFDLIVIGAGAAGLFCAGVAGQLGKKFVLAGVDVVISRTCIPIRVIFYQ